MDEMPERPQFDLYFSDSPLELRQLSHLIHLVLRDPESSARLGRWM